MSAIARLVTLWDALTARLQAAAEVVPPAVLRLIMGWEFWESGLEKLRGDNWFADIQQKFPWPFDIVPVGLSWGIATWFEIIGGVMLWLGLGTRFFAFSLMFLTFVATAAVHWPDMWTMWSDLLAGYSISNSGHGNFKLPLLFVVMLLPLIFGGAGKLSLDHLIARLAGAQRPIVAVGDFWSASIALAVIGLPFLMLIPLLGVVLLGASAALAVAARMLRA
ncbi:MAG TPA: DoxX family protein [Tahibacter sp.]|uniref:HvfX family Cu-binding RiPP maturation protein n=1 Tax=Tahibacter sp. TaxID=2056211 RepID=UPI002B658FF4|nr:DoxX family protein [Tahibacter sp.]HSX58800.1 DoxX family protein [Tahibacter sp.]